MNPERTITNEQAKYIFNHNQIKANSITKITTGFTNEVYSVDDKYILKVCTAENNEDAFEREAKLYNLFDDNLPVPYVVVYDRSKSVCSKHYMLYKKIIGQNVYDVWHTLSDYERREMIKQLCGYLQLINKTELSHDLNLDKYDSWKAHVIDKIERYLNIAKKMKSIDKTLIADVSNFVEKHGSKLEQQKLALVYWDIHFDNILIENGKITGLLDLERTNRASIDYVLNTIKRMMDVPEKYMAEDKEYLAKKEDYIQLAKWYKEFYPEIFDFSGLNYRVDLYTIAHDLEDLKSWPKVQWLKDNLKFITSETAPKLSSYLLEK